MDMAKKVKAIKTNSKKYVIAFVVSLIVLSPLALLWFKHFLTQKDVWCTTTHSSALMTVANPKTSVDYYNLGNYNFSTGDCGAAITAFTKSIELDSKFAESYNNRAYTYMRMGDYVDAIPDLNVALAIRPNYINALMNRGDVNNFYLMNYSRALNDYSKVVEFGGATNTSVCGHMMLARDQGWHVWTLLEHLVGIVTHINNIRLAGC